MEPEFREKVKKFHTKMTLVGGVMLVIAGLAGAYIVFVRKDPRPPAFLFTIARWFN